MSKSALFLKIIFALFSLLILVNLGFLDWQIYTEKKRSEMQKQEAPVVALPTPTLQPLAKAEESSPSSLRQEKSAGKPAEESCPQTCLLEIDKAVKTSSAQTSLPSSVPPLTGSTVKISYLPLGSGSTKSQDWADIPGLNTYIDPANYGKVKSVIFEASLRIPTANGRIYARLYNKNDGRPVWFSEISSEGASSTLIQSVPISFEANNKLYQVQAKTTMGFESFVDFARIKFITE